MKYQVNLKPSTRAWFKCWLYGCSLRHSGCLLTYLGFSFLTMDTTTASTSGVRKMKCYKDAKHVYGVVLYYWHFLFLPASLIKFLFKISCPKWSDLYGINKFELTPQASFLPWWVSLLRASSQLPVSWQLQPFAPPDFHFVAPTAFFPFSPTTGFSPDLV